MNLIIVHGAPCSGKTTYVRKHIKAKEIVYDYDMLAKAVTFTDKHIISERKHAHNYIVDFRHSMIRRLGKEKSIKTAYIIKTLLDERFKKLVEPLNPEYIEMETTKEECLKRLEADDERPNKAEWIAAIDKYFEDKEKAAARMRLLQRLNSKQEESA